MWDDLENLMIKEYRDEVTVIEAVRSLMNLIQARGEMTRKLGARSTKLSTMGLPEEVKENTAIQV